MDLQLKFKQVDRPESKIKAFVTITIDNIFVCYAKIIAGSKGLFVSYPSYVGNDNKYHSYCYSLEAKFNDAIISEYEKTDCKDPKKDKITIK